MFKRVFEQLKYCGVLETVKIARAGYPIRITKNKFIKSGDYVINLSAMPILKKGEVNTLRISKIE